MTATAPSPLHTTRYGVAAPTRADTAVSRSLSLYGEWAEGETDLLSGLVTEGHVIVEAGGELGAHAMWMAQAVGDSGAVHVIEPRRLPFQQLCANVALNQFTNVFTHHAWLAGDTGTHELDGEPTRAFTLDSLALPALSLLKVNLRDALPGVLAGATQTLARHQPLIYARLTGPLEAEAEVEALKALGYRVWSHAPLLFNADNHASSTRNIFPGMLMCNVIAAPADSGLEFEGQTEL